MPTFPLEISHYADFLKANAAIICAEHDGPYCRVLAKKPTNEGGPRVVTNAANFVAPAPQQSPRPMFPPSNSRHEVPVPQQSPRPMSQPNNYRSFVPVSRPGDISQRWCDFCQKPIHWEVERYLSHPEIKDRRLKEIADKKKARTQVRLAAHQLKKSQRPPAEQSS